jgi:hypothetical protein
MDTNSEIANGTRNVPIQEFLGKEYYLYPNERYFSKGNKRLHRVIWEHYKGEIPKGYDIHHKNGETTDNRIENLSLISRSLHARFTGKQRFKNEPEWFVKFQEKGIEIAKEWHKSPEGREWHKEHGKKAWINRPYKTCNCIECGKEYQTRHGGISKYCHNNCKAKHNRRIRLLAGRSI